MAKASKRRSRNPRPDSAFPRAIQLQGVVAKPPNMHPQGYAVTVRGDCLSPVVRDGEVISGEPVLPDSGELACFYFKGQETGDVKRLMTNLHRMFPVHPESGVVICVQSAQFNPPKRYQVWGDKLDAIHRVRWVMRNGEWLLLKPLLDDFDRTLVDDDPMRASNASAGSVIG